jgi:hypothetical protein
MEHQGRDRQRNRALFSGMVRGVSNPHEGSRILFFLFRSPLDYDSLLQLRSSCKVNSANYFALCVFSEVLHRPGPMRQGSLCGIGDSKHCLHTSSAKLAPSSQKMIRKTINMSK